ncbi:GNAT family protein [Microbacterium sp. 10M-3C3]|uniref:GNAT family N-acetyltransferase n=1 Tax=Microbacterium sp. 10M-3C3 TaxID=2483401 RepID=UPI0013DDFDAE|nr:GNAT family protein [Microbacterium sp. 10M-3C3]
MGRGRCAQIRRRNRTALARWEPERSEEFFADAAPQEALVRRLQARERDAAYPYLIDRAGVVAGLINIGAVERGAFQNGRLGYWIDEGERGRGLATRAVGAVVIEGRDTHRLRRMEAATLLENEPSQRLLRRLGFEEIGVARPYLEIAGRRQDHMLFQRLLGPEPAGGEVGCDVAAAQPDAHPPCDVRLPRHKL